MARSCRPLRVIALAVLSCALSAPSLSAHPHMSLTSRFEFVWEGERLSGVYQEWTFDKFFSADIIRAHDANRDGKFDAKEQKNVYQYAFVYCADYKFFTFIRQGDERTNPAGVKDFSARIEDGSIVYRFMVDLSAYRGGDISVAAYDYTFFCAIPYAAENPVTLRYDPGIVEASFEIGENKKYPVYYNPQGAADDATIYYAWKKGLLTFYPKEIHVRYSKKNAASP